MRVLVYDTHSYDRTFLDTANAGRHQLDYTSAQLDLQTAALAEGYDAVCLFVSDYAPAPVIERLANAGVRMIAQRSTGFNNLDLEAASRLGLTCMRVGYYSPYAVAEFAVGLLQTLNRRIHRAYNRTREFNFRLAGLLGHDIYGRTVGVVGTGKIGAIFARIMHGFGCPILAYDVQENPDCLALGATYVSLEELLSRADIISLHVPLMPQTYHMINAQSLASMKRGVMIINTSRGGLIDTEALIAAIERGHIAAVGLDVYEEEEGKFFRDLSDVVIDDDVLARLMTFPNVLLTSHQAFFTHEAMTTIAETTIRNLTDFEEGRTNENLLR
ncbi:2-hydroxyacid dehydrogenase [Candidatus Chloroploca sp. Khr17]|uniref:2-hydroxyacid dehydrogenase n=1 Tax=Candidatus Chloroploca sp. Khr17 TaxID=2496869 RepID=UPI00101CCE70|nr:2-hydroxyacid dehydrogenase [Candidatus Chloroploca sp. Khr17]